MVRQLLVIPAKYHRALLAQCAVLRPEYQALKNGIIVQKPTGDEVHILCDGPRVELIMNLAQRTCAEVIPHIQRLADRFFEHLRPCTLAIINVNRFP